MSYTGVRIELGTEREYRRRLNGFLVFLRLVGNARRKRAIDGGATLRQGSQMSAAEELRRAACIKDISMTDIGREKRE